MGFQYEEILLQILMILFPIVLFLASVKYNGNDYRQKIILGVTCAITMILSLFFAINIDEGKQLDLRHVPWYIAFIYGGNTIGIGVTLFFIVARFVVGGIGMFPAFFILILFSIVIKVLMKDYHQWSFGKKIKYSVSLIIAASSALLILGTFLLNVPVTFTRAVIYVCFVAENAVMVWLVVYLIESHIVKNQLFLEVQRSEKLNVVGQLAASVAHEIRNPITSIRGFMQLLLSSKNVSDEEKEYLNICVEEVDRANSIIYDYLSLGSKETSDEYEPLNIANEIEKSLQKLSSYAILNNVELMFNHQKKSVYIKGNSERIQQLFINLIKNGIEAIPDKGKIEVELTSLDKEVQITITDDGVGMKKECMVNLGLPFYSTKEKGTGLGLMVCLQIVRDLNGSLDVQSIEGRGTTFSITFPLLTPEAADDSQQSVVKKGENKNITYK